MGLLKNKFIAKFINGGAPPASFMQQIRDRPPPDYEAYATKQRIENEELQKTQIYLNLPTQKERGQLEQKQRERREKDLSRTGKKHRESRMDFAGRAGIFGGFGGGGG